jgi:hypothetical protein
LVALLAGAALASAQGTAIAGLKKSSDIPSNETNATLK